MKLKSLKKQRMSLLEVLIALALTAVLISTLLWFYRDVVVLGKQVDKTSSEIFQKRYTESRLSDVLSNAVFNNTEKKDFAFYTEEFIGGFPSLVFTYDNGTAFDEDFSNHVIGRLYLDEKGHLCLATWPSFTKKKVHNKYKMLNEVLLENVTSLTFAFFIPPEFDKKVITKEQKAAKSEEKETPHPPGEWVGIWKRQYQRMPAIIRIAVKQKINNKEEDVIYAFPLSDQDMKILFKVGS